MVAEPLPMEQLVRSLVPLRSLGAQQFGQLLARSSIADYPRGCHVFRQGDCDPHAYFLLRGSLELYAGDQLVQEVVGGSEAALYPLAQLQPRQLTARAKTGVTVLRLDRVLLEKLLSSAGLGCGQSDLEVRELAGGDDGDWMTRMLRSELFARIPAANIQRIFAQMQSIEVHGGQVIITQGAPGDYYYVIRAGRCEVSRKIAVGGQAIRLALLGPGDTFGEEALVAESRRNATVSMLTEGELMRLTKEDFVELIRKPLLCAVDCEEARQLIAGGAAWLDVRFPDECRRNALAGAENVPLNVLRVQMHRLHRDRRYIVVCDNGSRSAVGAFLLIARGLTAVYLNGGLQAAGMLAGRPLPRPEIPNAPHAATSANVLNFPPPVHHGGPIPASPRAEEERSLTRAPAVAVRDAPSAPGGTVEADVRASVLRAELAKANLQLEQALRLKAEAEEARQAAEEQAERRLRAEMERLEAEAHWAAETLAESLRLKVENEAEQARRLAQEQTEARLKAERERLEAEARSAAEALAEARRLKEELEAAKQAAEAEAERQRCEEEARIERLKAEAEVRLQEEKQKLETAYAWKEEELARVLKKKDEAEARLSEEHKRLEAEGREAKKRLTEALRIEREVEQTRQAAAAEAEERLRRQQDLEQRLRAEIRSKISEERSRLEAEFARNAEQLTLAQREREAAQAARIAAAQEAERIIAEYESAHEKLHAEQQARLQAERKRLEAEAQRIDGTLAAAERAREEAEAAKRAAEAEMTRLRQFEQSAAPASATLKEQLRADMQAFEAEVAQANQDIAEALQVHELAQAARQVNEESLERQSEEEERLRAEMYRDIEEWLREQDEIENSDRQRQVLANQRLHMERIKARAEAARHAAKTHDQALLDELASRLRQLDEW